jgi:trimeric autotransporter adhesin
MSARLAVVVLAAVLVGGSVAGAAQPPAIWTLAGVGSSGFSGDGGPAVQARLASPLGLAVDRQGAVYIADAGNGRVREVTPAGRISTLAQAQHPSGVAVDGQGDVFVSTGDHRVLKVTAAGATTTVAGTGQPGFSGDGGPATSAALNGPAAVAVDPGGNLYISDIRNNRVRKVAPDGTIATVAGTGVGGYSGDGGAATAARLSSPGGLAVDARGTLYIADTGNNRVRKVDVGGTITTLGGNGTAGRSGDGGRATAASLRAPQGVAVGSRGDVFVADTGNARVRRVSASGTITTFAGGGRAGYLGDYAPAALVTLGKPVALAAAADGRLYVTDGDTVREIGPAATSGPLVWKALGGTVTCGLAGGPRKQVLCDSQRVPAPPPSGTSIGDSDFVYLAPTGRPRLARLSQYSWVGLGFIKTVAVRPGRTWRITGTGIACAIGRRAVRCSNGSRHGFTITRRTYRSF